MADGFRHVLFQEVYVKIAAVAAIVLAQFRIEHRAAGVIVKRKIHSAHGLIQQILDLVHASSPQAHRDGNRHFEVILHNLAEFHTHHAGFPLKVIHAFR